MRRRGRWTTALVVALALVGAAASVATSAEYPTRPVRLVVPLAPGGATDIVARTLAQALAKTTGQPFVVENRAGGGGLIGAQAVKSAPADGYTLLFTSALLPVAIDVERAAGRTPSVTMDAFAPVAHIAADPLVLVVRGDASWRTVKDLLADARARAGRLTYGSGGVDTTSHLAMRALTAAAAAPMTHVPYRGTGPAVSDLIAGQIDALALPPAVAKPHVDAVRLRAIVTLAGVRSVAFPDTPTLQEAGVQAPTLPSWYGIFAPTGIPAPVQGALQEAIRAVAREGAVTGSLASFGLALDVRVGDDFRRMVDRDERLIAAVVRGENPPVAAAVAPSPPAPPPIVMEPSPVPPPRPVASPAVFGRYHAIVIGNQAYQHVTRLKTPVADARAVAEILRTDYGFHGVRLLLDATRSDMVRALDDTRRQLGEDDNLLIYYAGHGWLDREADRGYWLGVDAESDTRANWLSNADITDTLRALKAKHVLIVADSCYSGSLVRDVGIRSLDGADLARLARKRARTVLTSGGAEPVMDEGGAGHSVFARAFIDMLRAAPGASDLTSLFGGLRRSVLLRAEQTPQYSDLRLSGHDGGDFIFVRKR